VTISARLNDTRSEFADTDSAWIAFTVNGPVPNPPTGLNVTSITSTAATVRWTNGASSVTTVVEYRVSGTTTWIPTQATAVGATSRNLTGLTPQTTYQVQAKHVSGTQSSAYTSVVSFSTLSPPALNPPTGLNVTSITTSAATIRWTNGTSNVPTVVEYRVAGATAWIPTQATAAGATSRNFTGLTSQTTYEIRAKHVSGAQSSAYTPVISFTTLAITPPTVTNFRVTGCEQRQSAGKTHNYFQLAWNASPAQQFGSYQIAMHHTSSLASATVIVTVPGTQTTGEVGGYLSSPTLMNRWFWVRYVRNGTPATPWVALAPNPLATNQCLH
jgi:hypothetical protein